MSDSWLSPKLLEKIANNVPFLQRALTALVKQDPSSIADVPAGAKRLTEISQGKWQLQQFNGTSWEPLGKLMMDVDTLDTYHAALTPRKNTIPVRDANGDLPGNITGNANTANSAQTLSDVLEVALGGTGATTSAAARANLGVPPTSHASSSTIYGLGSNLNYGHVRGDGKTADVIAGEIVVKNVLFNNLISLTDSGALGKARYVPASQSFNIDTDDFDLVLINAVSQNSFGTYPPFNGFVYIRQYYYSRTTPTNIGNRMQVAFAYNSNKMWRRYLLDSSWSAWVKVIDATDLATASTSGIVKPDTINGTTATDSTGRLYVVSAPQVIGYDVVGTSDRYKDSVTLYRGPIGQGISRTAVVRGMCGDKSNEAHFFSANPDTNAVGALFILRTRTNNTKQAALNCDLQVNNGNSLVIAANTLKTGDLVASMNTSHSGCLLCNGSAVSRITYADLFALLGTAFGEGNGSTTFNLPDFRNKTLWGADGNLMAVLAAGLPNITGGFSIGALGGDASGAISGRPSGIARSTTNAYNSSGFTFDASRSSSIYGKSTTVQPPAIAVNIFIKY